MRSGTHSFLNMVCYGVGVKRAGAGGSGMRGERWSRARNVQRRRTTDCGLQFTTGGSYRYRANYIFGRFGQMVYTLIVNLPSSAWQHQP